MDSYFLNFSGLYTLDALSDGGAPLLAAPCEPSVSQFPAAFVASNDHFGQSPQHLEGVLQPLATFIVSDDLSHRVGGLIDLSDLEGTCCYCDPEAEETLERVIADLSLRTVHFIDSGDYHYVSKLFTDRVTMPFTLVLFDNHPDMQAPAFGDILSCGGWVRKALEENPFLERVIIIGSDPSLAEEVDDFCAREAIAGCTRVKAGSRTACDRVILLPADMEPSVLSSLVAGRNTYISVDKDVMSREYARTDWSQGTMTLPQLLALLNAVVQAGVGKVLGVDVCGGLSEAKGGKGEDFRINATSDRAILDVFAKL